MSQPYDPLPSANRPIYNEPFSPRDRPPRSQAPEMEPLRSDRALSPARPNFMGPALHNEYGSASRQSFASGDSAPSVPAEDYPSVYALDPTQRAGQRRSSFYGYQDELHDSDYFASEPPSLVSKPEMMSTPYLNEKREIYASPRSSTRRRAIIIGSIVSLAVVVIVVAVGVYFGVVKHNSSKPDVATGLSSGSSSGSSSSAAAKPSASSSSSKSSLVVTGGDGSTVTTSDGSTFKYQNTFGGYWYYDPANPMANYARAQSWTPALNESFNYGTDLIRGVNLGGWLVTEPFIVPALYQKYLNASTVAVDEWTLSQNMAADTASGGLQQLENHYATFITEQDFAEIAGAGLNYVRIPLPYWAIETRQGEPFLAKVCWTYFLKAIEWARKYGIRINLDFHSLPGSQNGWNHSGKLGTINVLNGPMGFANAQRSLDYIRIIAEFISQPEYSPVVTMFGVTNEPVGSTIGFQNLASYYVQAYQLVREASGTGEGNGPFISYHEGFFGLPQWAGFLPNSDRISLDIHPYICFDGQSADNYTARVSVPCSTWATNQNNSMSAFGLTAAGEFSNAINDCGLYVNGVNLGTRYEGTYTGSWPVIGSCTPWTDWQNWDAAMKASIQQWALESMDALQNFFFWTWKIGNSSATGVVESPQWSYQLGLQNGWMPTDPRQAAGLCSPSAPFNPPLQSWQTGGANAGNIPASATASFPWPPSAISNSGYQTLVTNFPSYTATGTLVTLPPPSMTASGTSVSVGDGWANPSDTGMMHVAIPTCSYLNPWVGPTSPPTPLCSSAAKREPAPRPVVTAFS